MFKSSGQRPNLKPKSLTVLQVNLKNHDISRNTIIAPDPDAPNTYITLPVAAYQACQPNRTNGLEYLLAYLKDYKITSFQLGYLVRHCLYNFAYLKDQPWLSKHEKHILSNILIKYNNIDSFCALNVNKSKILGDMRIMAEETKNWIRENRVNESQNANNILKKVFIFLLSIIKIQWPEIPQRHFEILCILLMLTSNPEENFKDEKADYTKAMEEWMK